jgi:micrococcal nuclease
MYEYNATLINVVDGDTMDFSIDLGFKIYHKIRVRLAGIDTPEIYHPKSDNEKQHGKEATAFVKQFIGINGTLRTMKDNKGKYGRYLADFCWVGEGGNTLCMVTELLKNGFKKRDEY